MEKLNNPRTLILIELTFILCLWWITKNPAATLIATLAIIAMELTVYMLKKASREIDSIIVEFTEPKQNSTDVTHDGLHHAPAQTPDDPLLPGEIVINTEKRDAA